MAWGAVTAVWSALALLWVIGVGGTCLEKQMGKEMESASHPVTVQETSTDLPC